MHRKLLGLMLPVTVVGVILSGCGHQSSRPRNRPAKPHTTVIVHRHNESAKPKPVKRAKQKLRHGRTRLNTLNRRTRRPAKRDTKVSVPNLNGLPTVSLGNGIQAKEDSGAGQRYVVFSIGRWIISVHGNDINGNTDTAKEQAVKINDWAQSHMLPAPGSHGMLKIDSSSNTAEAIWNGHTVRGSVEHVLGIATR